MGDDEPLLICVVQCDYRCGYCCAQDGAYWSESLNLRLMRVMVGNVRWMPRRRAWTVRASSLLFCLKITRFEEFEFEILNLIVSGDFVMAEFFKAEFWLLSFS